MPSPVKRIQMLVVDDHQVVLDGLKHVLNEHYDLNYIEFVTSVDSALASIARTSKLDIMLTDLFLPRLSGFDLLQRISDQGLVLPSIVLSSSEDAVDIKRAVDLGVSAFISKSAQSAEIIEAIETVVAGGMYLSADTLNLLQVSADHDLDDKKAVIEDDEALSLRQIDALKLIEQGFTNRQIASILELSESTVKYHIKGLFNRLDANTRTGCVRAAREQGFL